MRSPEKADELKRIVDVECFELDVLDSVSIRSAIGAATAKFGRIDAVLNNAGYGLFGPFESAIPEQIERQFGTNVFGLMNVCREILPYFREQKHGTIVNVASIAGRFSFPYSTLYNSTKWAVEGFSEALQYELRDLNIKVKVIEPGPIRTSFYGRSQDVGEKEGLNVYNRQADKLIENMNKFGESAPDGRIVAEVIYKAVTDGSSKLRYGINTKGLLALRKVLPDAIFFPLIRMSMLR